MIYLQTLGENTSPLNNTKGFKCENVLMAWVNLVAPPHGSASLDSTLYTSLKCKIVTVDDESTKEDIFDRPKLAACRTSREACKINVNLVKIIYEIIVLFDSFSTAKL